MKTCRPHLRRVLAPTALITVLLTGCVPPTPQTPSWVADLDCTELADTAVAIVQNGTVTDLRELDDVTDAMVDCSQSDVYTDYASAGSRARTQGPEPCTELEAYYDPTAVQMLWEHDLCFKEVPRLFGGGVYFHSDPHPGSNQANQEDPDTPRAFGGDISWEQAINHAGTHQRVCGPLAGTRSSHDDVFLNIGVDYPDPARFTIVIWDVGGIEPVAGGSRLCTSGTISVYEGVAQIELRDPADVEVYRD